MLPSTNKDYYGDETRWFMGIVVSVNDPLELGRLKVRIFGVHDANTSDISEGDLPWAQVVVPITEGGSSGIGTNTGIKEQAQVYGIFLDGKNSQLPLVVGSVPRFERSVTADLFQQESTVPDQVQHDDRGGPAGLAAATRRTSMINADETFLSGSTNIEKTFNFFLTKEGGGFEPHVAAAFIGNFYVESGAAANNGDLNPKARSSPPERSFGVAQWNSAKAAGQRYQNLVRFAQDRNLQWDTLYPQLLFTIFELTGPMKHYYKLFEIRKSKDVEEATFLIEARFENPHEKRQKRRVEIAEETLRRFT